MIELSSFNLPGISSVAAIASTRAYNVVNDDACDAVDVFCVAIGVMREFTAFDPLLAAVRSVANSNMFWAILVLNVLCRLLIVAMVEFIVLFCWVLMSVKSAMAIICVCVVLSSASIEVDKLHILELVPNVDKDVNMVGNVYCPKKKNVLLLLLLVGLATMGMGSAR